MATRTKSRSTPVERIKSLRNQLKTEMENVKVEFGRQLDVASQTYKVLIELGATDVFSEPKYAEAVRALGIGSPVEPPKKLRGPKPKKKTEKKSGSRKKKMKVVDAILTALASGGEMKNPDIAAKASEVRGKRIARATVDQTLSKLRKTHKMVQSVRQGVYKLKK